MRRRPAQLRWSSSGPVGASESAQKDADGKEKPGAASRVKRMLQVYGKIGLVTHISISAVTYTGCYIAISLGCPVEHLIGWMGVDTDNETWTQVGTAAIAYLAYKTTMPIRVPLTLTLTPIVARRAPSFLR